MMSELPDDLLEEIFFRLPATSLNRLRSTCKRWNRLFNDMRFTTKHLDKAPKQFQSLMLKDSRVCLMRLQNGRFTVKREATPTDRIDQLLIWNISHCDGLLLCCLCYTHKSRLVVWNPCTGQTKWIRPRNRYETSCSYALGSYQDKRSNGNSFKILRLRILGLNKQEFLVHEINSNSWRILDVSIDFGIESLSFGVSLKGKTYLFGYNNKDTFIVSFDYTTERFERLCLPYQYDDYETLFLSVVSEEKLALLLQHQIRDKAEIWVTNKISETKEVSWSKVLAFNVVPPLTGCVSGSFLYDEEKKVLVFSDISVYGTTKVYIVGEDNTLRQVELEDLTLRPWLFNYVPSLIRLPHVIRRKRKRSQ